MSDRTVILQLIDHLCVGGAQAVVRDLVCELADSKRYRQMVCSLQGANHQMVSTFEDAGIEAIVLHHHKYSPLLLPSVRQLCSEHNVWALHTHLTGSIGIGGLLKVRGAVPYLICHLHSRPARRIRRYVEGFGLRRADWLIPVSQGTRQAVAEAYGLDIAAQDVIHNGIDLRRFGHGDRKKARDEFGVDNGQIVVGFVGRLHRLKGVDVLIEAMRIASAARADLSLVIVGGGPLDRPLRRRVQANGQQTTVKFMGTRTDVPALLPGFDLVAMPSRWEALGIAAIEAMASSLPVIATDVNGLSEVVVDGVTGTLVPPNRPQLLARAIVELANDAEKRTLMGKAGRHTAADRFSREFMAKQVEQVYDEVLAAGRH